MRRTLRHDRQALGIYLYVSITEPPKYPHPWHLHLASQTWPTDPFHQCGNKPIVLDERKSLNINTYPIVR
jgi:hypothetical protein